jgi:hypothetical protein
MPSNAAAAAAHPERVAVLRGTDPAYTHENHAEDRVVDVHPAWRDVARPPSHPRAGHPEAEPDKRNVAMKRRKRRKAAVSGGHD